MIGETISHYRIIEKLGEGGMGVVYKAEDTKLKRTVALKFLPPELTRDPEAKQRFIHEAQAASALDHSNICTIYEIDEIPTEGRDRTFIAMACYDGETLRSKIQQGPLSLDEAISLTTQIAEGLQEAHEKGIVHRDIKPANIMITSKGQVKIMDFGLAKLSERTKLTKTGTMIGTVSYMSPEQTKGNRVDHRSDIWSLGAVLYEMITGQLPFKGDYEQAVVYSIMNEDPEPMTGLRTGVPIQLENMIDKTLAKSPDDRYQHIQEFMVDLRRLKKLAETEGSLLKIATVPGRAKKGIPRLLIAFAGIFAVIFLTVILYQMIVSPIQKRDSDIPKLVVLPFENLGSEDDTYFADGITEEITTRLATVSSLGVISRNSAFHYANLSKTTKQIGNELDVTYIVSGTVRWARSLDGPGRVRVMPRLIRVSDDLQLWAQPYERVVDDIFEIQTDIAKKVVEKLGLSLLKPELEAVEINPTENLEAYQAFLQGRHMTRQPHFTIENWEQVIRSYRRAVLLDPGFALAHAELAKAHSRLYFLRHDLSEKRLNMAKEAADRALALKPDSPEVRLSLGYYYLWAHRNPQRALEEWTIAEKGLPNNPRILEAKTAVFQLQGRFQEAIEAAKAAIALSPRDASLATDLALFLILTRDYSPAIEACNHAIALAPDELWPYLYKVLANWMWKGATLETRRILEAISFEQVWVTWFWIWQEIGERRFSEALERIDSHPGEWISHKMWAIPKSMFRAFIYTFQNRPQDALQSFEAAKQLLETEVQKSSEDPRYHSSLGIVYGALGYNQEAVREGKRAVELLPISKDAAYGIPYELDLAIIYTLIGDHDAALYKVEYLLSIPSWMSPGWLQMDFRYAPLYNHPRFKKLLSQ